MFESKEKTITKINDEPQDGWNWESLCNLICLFGLRAQSTFALILRLFEILLFSHPYKTYIFSRCAMMQTLGMFCVRGCVNFQRMKSRIT